MKICDGCQNIRKTEKWGPYMICEECAKLLNKKYKNKPKSDISDLKIESPIYGSSASYNPLTGETKLRDSRAFKRSQDIVFELVNHEFVHFLLHKMFGIRCCYQFDAVDEIVDPYHSLR